MSWDEYFENICNVVADNSKCFSRKIGAIIVKDKSIISTGYNGPPRGVPHCNVRYRTDMKLGKTFHEANIDIHDHEWNQCPRKVLGYQSGERMDLCIAGHAERNALINAARNGIQTKGCEMYMSCGIPCTPCLVEIINAGITKIIVDNFELYDETSIYLLQKSDLLVRKINTGYYYSYESQCRLDEFINIIFFKCNVYNSKEIRRFLKKHQDIIHIVDKTCDVIKKHSIVDEVELFLEDNVLHAYAIVNSDISVNELYKIKDYVSREFHNVNNINTMLFDVDLKMKGRIKQWVEK